MSNTKHTPGPWVYVEFKPQDRYEIYSEAGSRNCIAKINYNVPMSTNAECEANAKLIAKAWLIPELVEALQFCQSVIQSQVLFDRSEQLANEKALAAIKKATE